MDLPPSSEGIQPSDDSHPETRYTIQYVIISPLSPLSIPSWPSRFFRLSILHDNFLLVLTTMKLLTTLTTSLVYLFTCVTAGDNTPFTPAQKALCEKDHGVHQHGVVCCCDHPLTRFFGGNRCAKSSKDSYIQDTY